jgi:hypothetical protein
VRGQSRQGAGREDSQDTEAARLQQISRCVAALVVTRHRLGFFPAVIKQHTSDQ